MLHGALLAIALMALVFLTVKFSAWLADHGAFVVWVLIVLGIGAIFYF